MRKHWADFLRENKINYCFFSALFEQKKIEDETPLNQDILSDLKEKDKKIEEDEEEEEEEEKDNNYNMFKNLKAEGTGNEEDLEEDCNDDNVEEENEEEEQEQEETNEFNEKNNDDNNEIKQENSQENKIVQSGEKLSLNEKENKDKKLVHEIKIENKTNFINNDETIRILNREELILLFKEKLSKKQKSVQNSLYHIVGFVGYPNVGKSSVINVLMNAKRVNLKI
jgi:large subunit GTPase 1